MMAASLLGACRIDAYGILPQSERVLNTSQVGFTAEGEIKGLDLALYNNAGNSLDLSSSIMDRALLHTDNSYRLGAVRAVGHCCFTHQASNTAFRGFGGPQVGLRVL